MIILKKYKGFTLIEVLASVLILASLIAMVVQISYGNTRRLKKTRQLEKTAHLLEMKMMELEEQLKLDNSLPETDEGEFENEENYFWSYQTQLLTLPNPQTLISLIQVPENEINMKMAQVLTDVFSQSITELKLTVYYEGKKGKAFQYSLVSYLVNYNDVPGFVAEGISDLLPENPIGL